MMVQSYLFFEGRCEEALEFYKETLGAEVEMVLRFNEHPEPDAHALAKGDKVMHASFRVGETVIMASDGRCDGKTAFAGSALVLTVESVDNAKNLFAALGKGGEVQMPMAETFFSPMFGMVADKFGVSWMVMVECKK